MRSASKVTITSFARNLSIVFLLTDLGVSCSAQNVTKSVVDKTQKTWVDPTTGHRVTRLTDTPGSRSLYFTQNAFTPDGKAMIYTSPKGIFILNLDTMVSKGLYEGHFSDLIVGLKSRRIFFRKPGDSHLYSMDIDSGALTQLGSLPHRENLTSINADETLVAGTYNEGNSADYNTLEASELTESLKRVTAAHKNVELAHVALRSAGNDGAARAAAMSQVEAAKEEADAAAKYASGAKGRAIEKRLSQHSPENIFTMKLTDGEVKTILKGNDWLNHVQFSPSDPSLMMYSHEGPSLSVDRVWLLRTDGTSNELVHKREDPSESVTHEFWSHDGNTIWFDYQKPKGHHFFLAGFDVATGKRRLMTIKAEESSIHFNISPDGTYFCADGDKPGHSDKVQKGTVTLNKQWIWVDQVLKPKKLGEVGYSQDATGRLHSVRVVDMTDHNYDKIEPNVRFSPDGAKVIFTSNMLGTPNIFWVNVAKESAPKKP